MRRYLPDTNTAGHLIEKRGQVPERVREARRTGGRIGIGIPVLAELFSPVGSLRCWPANCGTKAED